MEPSNNAIEKALRILLLFTPHNREMGTVAISKKLAFHKATVSRILASLSKLGFIKQNPVTKKFKLGKSAFNLGQAVTQSIQSNNVVHIALPYLDELRDTLKETIVLEVLNENEVIMAYIVEGSGPIRIRGTLGDTRPVHASAGAKAILGFASAAVRKALLKRKLSQFTPNTITDISILRKQLKEIRQQGFAVDCEEVNIGINAVAVPIFDMEQNVVAAVIAAGLSHAIQWEGTLTTVNALKKTAEKISAQLYYPEDAKHMAL
jgi:IclR family transcriptional regulator, KDG regulon repressor